MKTTIFMVAGNDIVVVNKVYAEFFAQYPSVRTNPQVLLIPAGILASSSLIMTPMNHALVAPANAKQVEQVHVVI